MDMKPLLLVATWLLLALPCIASGDAEMGWTQAFERANAA